MFVVRIDEPGHPLHEGYLVSERYYVPHVAFDLQYAHVWKLRNGATRRANAYPNEVQKQYGCRGANCVVVPVTLIPGEPVKTKKTKSADGVP